MISVIIPSFNRADVILRAANSVLNQTYSDIELIIVDDCSTDNTREVVAELDDSRVRYICHETNMGACKARNTGIEAAKGEFIAFHDSDDEWRPMKLEKQMKAMAESGADICFCKYYKHKGNKIEICPTYYSEGFLDNCDTVYEIGTQTLLAKAEVFKQLRFDDRMPRLQELEWLVRANESFRIYCVEMPLVDYYVNDVSISSNPVKLLKACELLLDLHPDLLKKYKQMSGSLASSLLTNAQAESLDCKTRNKMCNLALKYKTSPKNIIKWLLIKTVHKVPKIHKK